MMMMVERRAAAQASAKRERQRAGISAAYVGASYTKRYIQGIQRLQACQLLQGVLLLHLCHPHLQGQVDQVVPAQKYQNQIISKSSKIQTKKRS